MTRIITDSTADIPVELIQQWDIIVAPLTVNFGSESYRDGIDLTNEAFFEKMAASKDMPTTSQVSIGEFAALFERELADHENILCINLSSELSGTYNAALQASKMVDPDRITVVDSRLVTFALGFVVVECARMLREGLTLDAVVDFAKNAHQNMTHYFVLDTLEYLLRGGRLSRNEAFIGNLLNIKPILTIEEGVLRSRHKTRGRKKAVQYVFDQLMRDYHDAPFNRLALYRTADAQMYHMMGDLIREHLPQVEILIADVGTVVGTHAGPGCVAMSYFNRGNDNE